MQTVKNMATVRTFEFASDKFNFVGIHTSGNFARNGSVNSIGVITGSYFLLVSLYKVKENTHHEFFPELLVN